MNSKNLRTIIFIIVGVLILGLFLKILPYIILGSIATYLVVKAYNYIKLKLNKTKRKESSSFTYDSSRENIENHSYDTDFDTSSAIDVDYKEVK